MATYYSDLAADPSRMYDIEGVALRAPFSLTISVAVVTGDLFYLAPILPGSTVCGYLIDSPALDTSGSASATCELGDATTSTLFNASGAAIQNPVRFSSTADAELAAAGASDVIGCLHGVLPLVYTAASYLILKLTGTVATAASSGTIKGYLDYVMQPKYRRPRRA